MSAAKRASHAQRVGRRRQGGAAAVEFALVGIVFFTFVFGIVELARAMYVFNTLQEVTRRAAAGAARADFSNAAAMDRVRRHAVLRNSAGGLLFAHPVTDDYVRIDYLAIQRDADGVQTWVEIAPHDLAPTPAENRLWCLKNPHAQCCIRLVRARVCRPDRAECEAAPFQTLLPFFEMSMPMHLATTIVAAESLGFDPAAEAAR